MSRESVHLSTGHPAFDTRIFHKECRTLAAAGFRVTLIVPHVNDEERDGVRIRAVQPPRNGRQRFCRTTRLVYRAALDENPDAIFHFHDPELLPFMVMLKLRGRSVVYDAHEDTPRQVMYQHWIAPRLRRPVSGFVRVLEWIGGRLFDGIITVNPVIARRFPGDKTTLVHNYPSLTELPRNGSLPHVERPQAAAYVGAITNVRGVRQMISAIWGLRDVPGIRLVLAGTFYPAALESEMRAQPGWRFVEYLGWLPRHDVVGLLGRARVGLVLLHPTEQYKDSVPTKLFEYMAAGLPVVASNFPEIRSVVEPLQCGVVVDPLDSSAVQDAIRRLLADPDEAEEMGNRGREAVKTRYNWEADNRGLLALYERLASTPQGSSRP